MWREGLLFLAKILLKWQQYLNGPDQASTPRRFVSMHHVGVNVPIGPLDRIACITELLCSASADVWVKTKRENVVLPCHSCTQVFEYVA